MAPKRPAVEATSSSSSGESASSSDEEHEEAPLSSPSPDKGTVQKKHTNPPAPAPQAPKPHPSQRPAAASSDEDEDDSEDEEGTSASESDDDRTKKQPQPPLPKPASQPTASGSSDGSGSGSDSEEESSDEEPAPVRHPSRGADPSIKPISSKPMDEATQPKKPAAASPSLKKKAKTPEPSENDGAGQKRPLFQRRARTMRSPSSPVLSSIARRRELSRRPGDGPVAQSDSWLSSVFGVQQPAQRQDWAPVEKVRDQCF